MRTWNLRKPLVVKPSELFCFKDTINLTALLLFLSGIKRQCIWVKYFELSSMAWPIKGPNSLGIKIYGKYQWIKKFDKHLYPILYTSYAIKKIYKNFVEGTSVITGPKCNKGPICNKHLDPCVIKVPSVITFWTQA